MRLLLGPPGSGKTSRLLDDVRRHARAGRGDFRYLAPTATLRDHVANLLAREGLVVRPSTIATLAGFLDELVPGAAVAGDDDLRMLTAAALAEARPAALERLLGSPGLAAALSRAMEELAGAGCDPGQWAALGSLRVWEGDGLRALGELYEAVEGKLRANGLMRRSGLLAEAARQAGQRAPAIVRHLYVDGFFNFSPYELNLIEALAKHVAVDVALPEWSGAREAVERLGAAGFRIERLTPVRRQPVSTLIPAPDEAREAEEVALRILEARREGFAWRDCGVILRGRLPYAPLLETTFSRFGIPWRAYFATPLMQHSAARCLAALVEACLAEWEHEAVLAALNEPACRAPACAGFQQFRRSVCEALPGKGWADLLNLLPEDEGLRAALEPVAAWSGGDGVARPPAEWARTLAGLVAGIAPPSPETEPSARGAAVKAFLRAAESAARLLPAEAIHLSDFWERIQPALAAASVRGPGRRRDAVHLLDVYEARQWELPVVFVCGLKEGEFPRRPSSDPVLSGSLRLRLRQQGFPLALTSTLEAEERFVFEIAQTRATHRAYYCWPQFNEAGEPSLRSFALDLLVAGETPARRIRVKPTVDVPLLPPASLDDHRVRDGLASKFAVHRTTSLESFLQCPFQFYARFTAELQGEPERPAGRLNPLFTGIVLHDVLKDWHQGGGAIERIFDSVWTRALARKRIPPGYAVEFARSVLRRSLIGFALEMPPETGWRTFVESPFELELTGCRVKGRIDRYDVGEDRQARVFDFKFSSGASVKLRKRKQEEGLSLQGGLYLLALQREGYVPLEFHYVGVKNELTISGWNEPGEVAALIEDARLLAEDAALQILQGRIEVNPRDPSACAWCDYRDACRIQSVQGAPLAETAG